MVVRGMVVTGHRLEIKGYLLENRHKAVAASEIWKTRFLDADQVVYRWGLP